MSRINQLPEIINCYNWSVEIRLDVSLGVSIQINSLQLSVLGKLYTKRRTPAYNSKIHWDGSDLLTRCWVWYCPEMPINQSLLVEHLSNKDSKRSLFAAIFGSACLYQRQNDDPGSDLSPKRSDSWMSWRNRYKS